MPKVPAQPGVTLRRLIDQKLNERAAVRWHLVYHKSNTCIETNVKIMYLSDCKWVIVIARCDSDVSIRLMPCPWWWLTVHTPVAKAGAIWYRLTWLCTSGLHGSITEYSNMVYSLSSTLWVKKAIHLTFDHNFGKCRPIYKFLSLSDSSGNFVQIYYKDSPPHLKYASTLPCETWQLQLLLISMAHCMWDLWIHLARYEAALIAQV